MCGICGIVSSTGESNAAVRRMAEAIHHRGPDDSGYFTANGSNHTIDFGFKRLAIIDLSETGHQPMTDLETGNTIVFNGEIYNFKEIRKELFSLGHHFRSNSDTEVILKSYAQWGKDCLTRFIGMFALVIYDQKSNVLFGARDRLGVKPFYYHQSEDLFLFCSEIKGIMASHRLNTSINIQSVGDYLKYGYTLADRTIYTEIRKLEPGHYFNYDLSTKTFNIVKYWDYDDLIRKRKVNDDYTQNISQLSSLFESAFSYRMIADVPVGLFLSGGIDSTLLAAMLVKKCNVAPEAYTIGFKESEYDESGYASQLASYLGIKHHIYICTAEDAKSLLPGFYDIYDEPFADTSGIPTYLVSRFSQTHTKVALSADGSDEVFNGYTKYHKAIRYLRFRKVLRNIPFIDNLLSISTIADSNIVQHNRLLRLRKFLNDKGFRQQFDTITAGLTNEEVRLIINSEYRSNFSKMNSDVGDNALLNFSSYDVNSYLPNDILQKVDMAGMHTSLEIREPFLDHRILEFAVNLPDRQKLHNHKGKVILRNMLKTLLPAKLYERPKKGFTIPIEEWCKGNLKEFFLDILNDDAVKRAGIFNERAVLEMKQAFVKDGRIDFNRLFRVFSYLMWYRNVYLKKY